MKIDRKFRKTLSEIPNDCKQLIEKLKNCTDNDELLAEICSIKSWNIGKCELYHWADVLDRFNGILEQACAKSSASQHTNTSGTQPQQQQTSPDSQSSWQLACDFPENSKLKMLLLAVLQFTALLIEHSYSRHLYNSIEHLTTLLESIDFHVILSVLNLLYVFSKRSIFINRLSNDKKQALLQRLLFLAESWGGKENGLDLVKCCLYSDLSNFPASATAVNFEYTVDSIPSASITNATTVTSTTAVGNEQSNTPTTPLSNKIITTKHVRLEKVHLMHENPAVIMERVQKDHPDIPEDKRVLLFTYIRLAHSFPNYEKRKLFVQARLQALSILVYSGAIQEHANNLLYDGLIEELVDVLTVKDPLPSATTQMPNIPPFPEIKAASLKTLTAIIHLEKTNKLNEIIDTTQASSYHGLLPALVRKCVEHLIDASKEPFPHQFATSLFSFLYHLATYDTGGDALVKCGIMETLLKVVNHNHNSQEYIMFVTRAVRVIDLITNLDMSSFEAHQGLITFINRLEYEVNECRKEQPYEIKVKRTRAQHANNDSMPMEEQTQSNAIQVTTTAPTESEMDITLTNSPIEARIDEESIKNLPKSGLTCYHQRSALLKSILNFFKKVIADSANNNIPNLGDSIRHMMEGSLPNSLKHIISNADYYGPSLFLLATDVVQLFIFQEPSQLSQLQENGLTDVILYALLRKNVPATREVLGSLPTVFSALCLNTNGLNAFIQSKPFDKLFQVLLSPDYLPAMRRRRNQDQVNATTLNAASSSSSGTASQLGSAMDELMRHQPSLRIEAMNAIINLLNKLIEMGRNPNYICQRQSSSSTQSVSVSTSKQGTNQVNNSTNQSEPQTSATQSTSAQRQRRSSTRNSTSANNVTTSSSIGNHQTSNDDAAVNVEQQSSDDENNMDEYESGTMMIDSDTNTAQPKPTTSRTTSAQAQQTAQTSQQPQQQPESIPLLDYINNIMKFVEAILSNNSTDDHCKEFVKQKGLIPLMEILTLPNLPVDFPSSTACQSIAQVCKAILHLAREPQVIDQALSSLSEALKKCDTLYNQLIADAVKFDGSVLIRELAQSENPLESFNYPSQTPLLHALSSVHSIIYLLVTLGKINQNEVRNLTINKWGSEQGVKVLKELSKTYKNTIWESSMLLWLCNDEQQQQQLIQLQQLQVLQQPLTNETSKELNNQLATLIQQLSASNAASFEFNKADLERIKNHILGNQPQASSVLTFFPLATSTTPKSTADSSNENVNEKMDVNESAEAKPSANMSQAQPVPIVSYSKTLRPLFNACSKLGRNLCELFGLLVKLSAGSYKNQNTRRNMIPLHSSNATPTPSAINISSAIAEIGITGFASQQQPNIESELSQFGNLNDLHPKFRLTFYICSIGFTSSILLDEQKRPYHLMLQRFDQLGGLKAMFDSFYWSLSLLNDVTSSDKDNAHQLLAMKQDRDRLQEGAIEFIEAWLLLLQKLVNTKNMLDTRHALNAPNSSTINPEVKKVCSFDPIKFLFKLHKEAFQALMCLWDSKSFIIRENYSLSETVLNILCQILIGDDQLQKRLVERQQQQNTIRSINSRSQFMPANIRALGSSSSSSLMNTHEATGNMSAGITQIPTMQSLTTTQSTTTHQGASTRQLTPLDEEIILQMISMGFSPELAQEAVSRSPPDSLEQAVEYCFTHASTNQASSQPSSAPASVTNNAGTTTVEQQPTTSSSNASSDQEPSHPVIEMSSMDNSSQLPDLSRPTTVNLPSNSSNSMEPNLEEELHQLDKTILDKFASTMITGLMKILDNVPETVYRVCELIVVVVKKYGEQWRDNCLSFILNETCDLIKQVSDIIDKSTNGSTPQAKQQKMDETASTFDSNLLLSNAFIEQKLASRLLLFCLLFEEMQLACAKIVNVSSLLDKLVNLLQMITLTYAQNKLSLKLNDNQIQTPVWLTSLFILVDLIEKAALATRRKAAINEQFQQYHRVWKWYDERQNRWIAYSTSNNKVVDAAYKNGDTNVRIVASRKHYIVHFNTMIQENEETLHKRPVMLSFDKATRALSPTSNQSEASNQSELLETEFGRPSSPLPTEIVNGLEKSQIKALIGVCVDFISWPVSDPDCLHAILRLVLRLTRQHENAIEFATRGGPQLILNLTQRNSFMGFASLITLIFRHVCEDEQNLRLTMEKAIRLALNSSQVSTAGLQPGGVGSKELHNVLRLLGPAICRHPDIFCEVACDILRIVIKKEDEAFLNTSNLTQLEQTVQQTLSNNIAYTLRTVSAKLMPATSMPHYAKVLVIDLLNYLIKPSVSSVDVKGSTPANNNNKSTPSDASKNGKTNQNPASATGLATTATSSSTSATTSTQTTNQPLISKSGVLRILSELVRSYAGCAKIISQHVYKASEIADMDAKSSIGIAFLNEDCNALAFLLDNLLASNQTFGDKDCPSLCRLLIVALASCNHCLETQNALVQEVKLALNRAVNLPESNDKYIKIQAFASIINTMIETCPPIQNQSTQANGMRNNMANLNQVNNMMKIMHKKGLINDLARVPLHIDLSSSKCIETINTLLKPLETMTKTLNTSARKRDYVAKMNIVANLASTRLREGQGSSRGANQGQPAETSTSLAQTTGATGTTATTSIDQQVQQSTSGSTSEGTGAQASSSQMAQITEQDADLTLTNIGGDEQMVDLNMTEMEPQQTLPQDVDMIPTNTHHHRERVFDRVMEALDAADSGSDSEYEDGNRILRYDNAGDQIHIQIGTADDDDEESDEDESDDDDDDNDDMPTELANAARDMLEHSSEGEEELADEEENVINDSSVFDAHADDEHVHGDEDSDSDSDSDESDSDSDSDSDDDDHDDDDDEDDDDENIIDEELVEGSDGRSAVESDLSDEENQNAQNATSNPNANSHSLIDADNATNSLVGGDSNLNDPNVVVEGGVMTTSDMVETSRSGRRRGRAHRHHDNDEDDDVDQDESDEDDEDMELDDDEEENELDDEEENDEILHEDEDAEGEEENEDEDDDEEENEDDDEEENEGDEDEETSSEYYEAYNHMLDLITDDTNENDDEFFSQIENLWPDNPTGNPIVLSHQLGNAMGNRNYQINIYGGANGVVMGGTGLSVDGNPLPPHPLSVSAVHPLLAHRSSNDTQTATSNITMPTIQLSGVPSGVLNSLTSAISPLIRTVRQHIQQQQQSQQQSASSALRMHRLVLPTSTPALQQLQQTLTSLPSVRVAGLPYNTLNEIMQGLETPSSALQTPQTTANLITAPAATSFIDLLTGASQSQRGHQNVNTVSLGGGLANNANTLASLNNQEFLVNLNNYNNDGFGENIGNGTTNLYIIRTPLARWNEECTVLDSHSMHHAILLNKPRIMDALEKHRNDELNEKRLKRLKEEEEAKKGLQDKQSQQQQQAAQPTSTGDQPSTGAQLGSASEVHQPLRDAYHVIAEQQAPSESMMSETPTLSETESNQTMPGISINNNSTSLTTNTMQSQQGQTITNVTQMETEETSTSSAPNQQTANEAPSASGPAAESPAPTASATFLTPADREAATNFLINFVGATCSVFTLANIDERRVAIEALRIAEHQRASLELQEATDPSSHSIIYPLNFVFLDGHVVEIPTGIDPSFLSALPDSLRREVIIEQLRVQGIDIRNRPIPSQAAAAAQQQQETQQAASQQQQDAAAVEINPDFLAALPPQIQEELLTQQRLEQQARAAAETAGAANAEDDNTAFMRSLPASLRQAILIDMEQSQISALPEDLANEARQLQQQHREREIDLFAHHTSGRGGGGGGHYLGNRYTISGNRSGLTGIYNVASSLLQDSYFYGGGHGRGGGDFTRIRRGLRRYNGGDIIFNPSALNGAGTSNLNALERARSGRQLLDQESLACLLVLLFIDDPRLNMVKLHRVVRNLCIHNPTRAWVIRSLLCILEKVSGKPEQASIEMDITQTAKSSGRLTKQHSGSGSTSKSPGSANNNKDSQLAVVSYPPSWLTMAIDGAFGSKTPVFTITKPTNKKISSSKLTPIQSSELINNSASISINHQACPAILKQLLEILSTLARVANFNFFPRHQQLQGKQQTHAHHHHKQHTSFWDLVVKLDQSKNKTSKLSTSAPNQKELSEFESDSEFSVENSPLARLMSMLDYPVLKGNPTLMDKMFTCLAYASAGIPISDSAAKSIQSSQSTFRLRARSPPSELGAIPTENEMVQGEAASTETIKETALGKSVIETKAPVEEMNNEPVLNRQIELVVNVLKNKLCSQDGLQQAYTLLNNLSKINHATRNMIIAHLLKGTKELGLAVCREIEVLMEEAVKYNQTVAATQPTTSAGATSGDEAMDSVASGSLVSSYGRSTQQNLIDSYSNLVISSPKTKQTRELQLPSMSMLVEKNSNQKFFVRLIKLIISLRETIEKEAKKKKQAAAAAAAVATTTTTTTTASGAQQTPSTEEQQQQGGEAGKEQTSSTSTTDQSQITPLARLSSELDLEELWSKLSSCLTVLKSLSDPYAVLILQQTVEAFFYVHAIKKDENKKKEKETKEAQLAHLDTESGPMSPQPQQQQQQQIQTYEMGKPSTSSGGATSTEEIAAIIKSIGSDTSPDTKRFLEFALTHRTVLNHILRQTSNNLSEEPYSVLIDFTRIHTHILDFDVKRRYFRQELDKLKDSIRGDDLAVHVRRTHVFDDSYRELNRRSPDDWKHRFYIVFEGEEGQDAGGLLREWYMIISKEIFNPDYALFMINPGDRVTYMPNPSSHFNPNHLSYFKFIGHIIAKAIFDNKFLDCYFTRAFYKHILGVPVKYTDMESVDNEFYKNLVSILESDIDSLGVDLCFSIDINEFGVTQTRDLKPNGRNLRVTNENKIEYVRLVCQEKMIGSIRQQVSSFLQGFYEIIPKSLISIFNEQELELLISGLPEIDLEDLRRNTEYHKYTTNSLQIQWFWRALKAFDKEDQAKFLQFVTGTSKVPLQGFAKLEGMNGPQKFQIHRDDRDTSRLPCAHTCFNQLDLPAYENYEKLRQMLLMAIRECSTGFGLA